MKEIFYIAIDNRGA